MCLVNNAGFDPWGGDAGFGEPMAAFTVEPKAFLETIVNNSPQRPSDDCALRTPSHERRELWSRGQRLIRHGRDR